MSWPMASTLSSESESALQSFLRKSGNAKFTKPVLLSMMPAVHEILGDAATAEFVELVQSELHNMFELSRKNGLKGVKKKDATDLADAFQQLDFDKIDRSLGKVRKRRAKNALKKAKKLMQDKEDKEERRSNRIKKFRVDPLYVDLQSGSSAEDELLFCVDKNANSKKSGKESQEVPRNGETEGDEQIEEAPEKDAIDSSSSVMELDAESSKISAKSVKVSLGEEGRASPATTVELDSDNPGGSEGEKKEADQTLVEFEVVSEVKGKSGIAKNLQSSEKSCDLITIDSECDSRRSSPVVVDEIKVESVNEDKNPEMMLETKENVFVENQKQNDTIDLSDDSTEMDAASQASSVVTDAITSSEDSDSESKIGKGRLRKKKRKRKSHSRVAALKSGKLSMAPVVKLRRMLLPSKYLALNLLVKDEKAEEDQLHPEAEKETVGNENLKTETKESETEQLDTETSVVDATKSKSNTEMDSSTSEASEKCELKAKEDLKKDEASDDPESDWSELNSDDDASDQSDEEKKASLEDAEAVMVCVFDKIIRKGMTSQKKVSWKFYLRNGILMHEGRELFFDLALGKASFL